MADSGLQNDIPEMAKNAMVVPVPPPPVRTGGFVLGAVLDIKKEVSEKPPTTESPGSAGEKRRASPDVEGVKVSGLGLRGSVVSGAASHVRHGNQRRGTGVVKLGIALVGVLLVLFAGFGAMLYSYYQRTLVPELQSLRQGLAARVIPTELESVTALVSMHAELTALQREMKRANEQITALQKQISTLQNKQDVTDERLGSAVERIQNAVTSGGKPADGSPVTGLSTQVASVVPMATPANQELWLLKERNRLTFYADQAIARGSSEAMTNLWRSLDDPDLAKLREGVQAEIIRVQNYYSHLSRLPPEYRLPVRELFAGNASIRSEADLQPPQLIKLLLDEKQTVEVRARSAFILGGHRSDEVAKALIQCMKLDPVLDVVKEAQRTLADDYNMRVPPLHLKAAEEWWQARAGAK